VTRSVAVLVVTATAVVLLVARTSLDAHRTAVSPYTYYRDVLPILEARCIRCHTDSNVSGVSLASFEGARGSTWPMRLRLMRGHMPPWFAEGPFKSPDTMTARELNILMTWATGGAPEGRTRPQTRPQIVAWPGGQPDQIVPMPSTFTLAELGDRVHEVKLAATNLGGRTIRAVSLLPGTPAIVRSAEVAARRGADEQVIGLWQPGEVPTSLPLNAGFRLQRGAELILRVHYRRSFGSPTSDHSQVGLYFADRQAAAIRTIDITADTSNAASRVIERPARLVAIRPDSGPSGARVSIAIVGVDGSRRELGRLEMQADWKRRYAFTDAVQLNRGDKIVAAVIQSQSGLWSTLTTERTDPESEVKLVLEVID